MANFSRTRKAAAGLFIAAAAATGFSVATTVPATAHTAVLCPERVSSSTAYPGTGKGHWLRYATYRRTDGSLYRADYVWNHYHTATLQPWCMWTSSPCSWYERHWGLKQVRWCVPYHSH